MLSPLFIRNFYYATMKILMTQENIEKYQTLRQNCSSVHVFLYLLCSSKVIICFVTGFLESSSGTLYIQGISNDRCRRKDLCLLKNEIWQTLQHVPNMSKTLLTKHHSHNYILSQQQQIANNNVTLIQTFSAYNKFLFLSSLCV